MRVFFTRRIPKAMAALAVMVLLSQCIIHNAIDCLEIWMGGGFSFGINLHVRTSFAQDDDFSIRRYLYNAI